MQRVPDFHLPCLVMPNGDSGFLSTNAMMTQVSSVSHVAFLKKMTSAAIWITVREIVNIWYTPAPFNNLVSIYRGNGIPVYTLVLVCMKTFLFFLSFSFFVHTNSNLIWVLPAYSSRQFFPQGWNAWMIRMSSPYHKIKAIISDHGVGISSKQRSVLSAAHTYGVNWRSTFYLVRGTGAKTNQG